MADYLKPMLAKSYDPAKHHTTGWLMSEKLDGVRAIWTGREFVSRNGKVFDAPYRILARMPNVVLDGELYIDRGRFNETSGIVRRHGDEWLDIRYHVFDLPASTNPFVVRYADLVTEYGENYEPDFIQVVEHHRLTGPETLDGFLSSILSEGGEGVMLKCPNSLYQNKRSADLLKVKVFKELEARCYDATPGKGKHEGRIGALCCKTEEGAEFQVGTGLDDRQRSVPPGHYIGKQITVKYFEVFDNGVPRFPVFKAVRDYE